jgi:hypothetical protein
MPPPNLDGPKEEDIANTNFTPEGQRFPTPGLKLLVMRCHFAAKYSNFDDAAVIDDAISGLPAAFTRGGCGGR